MISPRPNERLRMISARRAREADLDKAVFLGVRGERNLSADLRHIPAPIRRRQQRHGVRRPCMQGRHSEQAGCKPLRFRATEDTKLSLGKTENDHRTAHLEHAERPQDLGRAGGNGAALQGDPGEHQQGRADGAGVPRDQPEQQDSRDRRSRRPRRQARQHFRVRRDPALSRREDRQVPAQAAGRAHPGL